MKKRLRKKLRCGEFTEYAFSWSALLHQPLLDHAAWEALVERVIQGGDERGFWLGFGGSIGATRYAPRVGGFCYPLNYRGRSRKFLSQEESAAAIAFLRAQPDFKAVVVGKRDSVRSWDEKYQQGLEAEFDRVLGADGPRCCLGSYIYTGRDGERGCSICRKPWEGE